MYKLQNKYQTVAPNVCLSTSPGTARMHLLYFTDKKEEYI